MKIISVIIPNYKREKKLKRAIDSVLDQTIQNIEIIIIDDSSPNIDNIEALIKNFNDNRITLIKNKNNQGGSACRNIGILKAEGKYIAFLDSDDYWEKTKLEKQINLARNYSDEHIFIYTRSTIFTRNNKKRLSPTRSINPNESIADYLFINNGFIPTPSMFLNKELAEKCLFDESLPRHQDYDFIFKIEKNCTNILMLNESLVNIDWSENSSLLKKGWTPEFSESFAKSRRNSFSETAFKNFIFTNAVYHSIIYSQFRVGIRNMLKYKLFSYKYLRSTIRATAKTFFKKYNGSINQ